MLRDAFLETANEALELLRSRDVERAWDQPSALRELTVGALGAHLGRAILTVEFYLAVEIPTLTPRLVTADEYFDTGTKLSRDISDELNIVIRARSIEAAARGHETVVTELATSLQHVDAALQTLPADHVIIVIHDLAMLLDEYLVTRMVELVVHIDDLSVSVGRDTPDMSPVTSACALGCLFATARRRHGDIDVMRALARTERLSEPVFPVL